MNSTWDLVVTTLLVFNEWDGLSIFTLLIWRFFNISFFKDWDLIKSWRWWNRFEVAATPAGAALPRFSAALPLCLGAGAALPRSSAALPLCLEAVGVLLHLIIEYVSGNLYTCSLLILLLSGLNFFWPYIAECHLLDCFLRRIFITYNMNKILLY